MLVDDDPSMLNLASTHLERNCGFCNFEAATSPKDALDLIEEGDFDCIVSDFQMPEMDGLEFLETVKRDLDKDIAFILFTGRGREEVAMKALNLGADRYIRKGGTLKASSGSWQTR